MQEQHLCFSMIPDKFPVKCDENTEHRTTISYISIGSKHAGHPFLKPYSNLVIYYQPELGYVMKNSCKILNFQTSFTFRMPGYYEGWCQKHTIKMESLTVKIIKLWSPSTNSLIGKRPIPNTRDSSMFLGVSLTSLTHTSPVIWHSHPFLTAKPVQSSSFQFDLHLLQLRLSQHTLQKPRAWPPNKQHWQEGLTFFIKKPQTGPRSHGGDPPSDNWLGKERWGDRKGG